MSDDQKPQTRKRSIALLLSSVSTSLFINTLWYELPLMKRVSVSDEDHASHVFTLFFCVGQLVTVAYFMTRKLLGKPYSIAVPVLYCCQIVSLSGLITAYFLLNNDDNGQVFDVNNMTIMLFVLLSSMVSSIGEVAFLDYKVKDLTSCGFVLMGIALSSVIPQALTIPQGLNSHLTYLSAERYLSSRSAGVSECKLEFISDLPLSDNSTLRVVKYQNKGLGFKVPTFLLIISFVNLISLLSFIYLRFIVDGDTGGVSENSLMISTKTTPIEIKNKHSSFITVITVLWTSIVLSGPISIPVSHSCYPPNGSLRFVGGSFLANITTLLFIQLSMRCNSKLRITYSIAFTSLGTIVMFYFGALVYFGRSASILTGRSYKTLTSRLFYGGGSLMFGNTGEYLTIITWCAIVGIFSYTKSVAIREFEDKTKGIDILWLAMFTQIGRLIGACMSSLSALSVCILFRTPARTCY